MKKLCNGLLLAAVIIPLVLLFWPFATWHGVAALILRVVPAFAAQLLLCRVGKYKPVKAIPVLLTLAWALWGTYLFCTSDHWINVTLWELIADNGSPFIGCVAALLCAAGKRKEETP